MGGSLTSRGWRIIRVFRLLLLLMMALVAVDYVFGTINDKTQLHANWFKGQPRPILIQIPEVNGTLVKNIIVTTYNSTTLLNTNTTLANNTTLVKKTTLANATDMPLYNIIISPTVIQINDSIKNSTTTDNAKKIETVLPLCDLMPQDLGPIPINKTELELEFVERKYPEVQRGGHYKPPNCTARHKVAIIVPYRNRQKHLAIFLNHMHPFLMKQQIEYGIFIIEQEGKSDFNRAKLMNVGFSMSMILEPGGWQCFIFHDVDLLPLDTRNLYSCPRQPRHMSASIYPKFKLLYENIFGGVSAITQKQFLKVNGFSNKYWGWGGEDDDMFHRLKNMNYHVARYKRSIARYMALYHKRSAPNPKRYKLLSNTSKEFKKDGLSTLEYELVQVVRYHLYTHVLADIDERS